jgi:polysaccharide export outer membrane protein
MEINMRPTRKDRCKSAIACLMAVSFSLTACTTTRSQNQWHDLGSHQPPDTAKVSPLSQKWGKEAESVNPANPMISPGNLISIKTSDDPKLNGDYRVDFDGALQLPYDMVIHTSGLTLSDLQKRLEESYKPYFKTTSGIRPTVKERRYWLDVRGLVDKPGRYLVDQDASLDQVLAMAGGFAKETSPRYVRIQKGAKSLTMDLSAYRNKGEDQKQLLAWLGGETVYFQRDAMGMGSSSQAQLPVYILGEVRKPGEYSMRPGMDVVDLISQADGFTDEAELSRLEVIRRSGGKQYAYDFKWDDFQNAPELAQGDVMMVHSRTETKTERHIGIGATILTAIASILTSAVVAYRL